MIGEMKTYGIRRTVPLAYDVALARVRDALKDQGFGILSEIDIREKLKEKLGVDFMRYVILGACNPPLAYKALQAENDLGLLLPCNVIVYETGEAESVVAAVDPDSMVEITQNDALRAIADDARIRLEKAIASV
jgi:uncharacterized protein (DUF302 family)